jgi:acyl-ACP thioesterase
MRAVQTRVWEDRYPVRFFHVNEERSANPSLLCDFMQDSAVNHIEALGHSLDLLQQHNHGWFMSKMFVQLRKLPLWKDTVHIETWQPGIDRMYALRDYILTDGEGQEVGRATSFWLAVDKEKEKLIRPEVYLEESVFDRSRRAFNNGPDKIRAVTKPQFCDHVQVQRNHLDLNGHANSIVYLKWMMDQLKQNNVKLEDISFMELNYNSQSFVGDNLTLHCRLEETQDNYRLSHHSLVRESDNTNICNARFRIRS